jgi:hypothetical protein
MSLFLSQYTRVDRRLYISAILFSLILNFQARAEAQPAAKDVQAIGTARIYRDNVSAAREQAIANSLLSAVDSVVLNRLPMESLIKNFRTTNEVLYDQTRLFIQGYKVLAEMKYKNTYRVVVQASVLTANIEEQLSSVGIVLGEKTLPRLLFFVAESRLDDVSPRYWWGEDFSYSDATAERAIAKVMTNAGFSIITPEDWIQLDDDNLETDRPDLDNQSAVLLAKRFEAGVAMVGKSTVERTANIMGGNIRSFRATVSIRALDTETGMEIANTVQTGVASHENEFEGSDEALLMAGTLAGEALSGKIASIWQKRSKKTAMIKIIVEGTRNLSNFVLFRKTLNDISGVEELKTREMRPNTSTLMIDYKGSPRALGDSLLLKTFDTFGINITEVSEDHLRVEIVSK